MKTIVLAATATLALFGAGVAGAEPYVDWTPQKGLWHVVTVKVDPNHIDDYLVGLKKTWVPGEEVAKKHGIIDSYSISVKMNASDGKGNVIMVEHFPNTTVLDPDKARDQAMDKEVFAATPKTAMDAQVKDFEKYRTFVGDDYYGEISYTK